MGGVTTLFGVVADDFTGATDIAGLLGRSGANVSLRLGIPAEPPEKSAPIEIIALKCRTAPVDTAVSEALAAISWLRRAGAERFYWKYCSTFDSTPRGNIGPVAEALMDELGAPQTIHCPAFPENGRFVFMGNLFVGEQLLAESPMKDHPLTPMRDSNLLRLLAPQTTRAVGLVNRVAIANGVDRIRERLAELSGRGVAHVVVDAVADEDLQAVAEACQDMALITGGSALAKPLPELWLQKGLLTKAGRRENAGEVRGPAIVLSGSSSAMTNRQVAAYLKEGRPAFRLDPIALAGHELNLVLDWLSGQPADAAPIIYATADPETIRAAQNMLGADRASEVIENALATCAAVARDRGTRRFVVAGGETSAAVAKALGVSRLDIGAEISPGVPWCFAKSNGYDIAIALKSGNFGGETFFADALRMLGP